MVLDGSKVAVVVGASRGIGLALAKRLSEKGHEVFATCRTTSDAIDSMSAQCSNFHTVPGARCLPAAIAIPSTQQDSLEQLDVQ